MTGGTRTSPSVVLVHGAWADVSGWDGEIRPPTPAITAGRRKRKSTAAESSTGSAEGTSASRRG